MQVRSPHSKIYLNQAFDNEIHAYTPKFTPLLLTVQIELHFGILFKYDKFFIYDSLSSYCKHAITTP